MRKDVASALDGVRERFHERTVVIGAVGVSYGGRPPAPAFTEVGYRTIRHPPSEATAPGAECSYLLDILSERVAGL